MANIVIERDDKGQIVRITRRVAAKANVSGLVGFGMISAVWVAEVLRARREHSAIGIVFFELMLCGSAYLFAVFLLRVLRGGGPTLPIADRNGVIFRSYVELGVVPWAAIDHFYIEPSDMRGSGGAFLVASIYQSSDLLRRLKRTNKARPGAPYAPPFPSVERAWAMNLPELKASLDELHAQVIWSRASSRPE